ncbi:MAG: hypothetical protein IJ655_02135 [Lachnospiraceae bacterium]|nr:hypothetical protein [Lachnospiraceae bacterium]
MKKKLIIGIAIVCLIIAGVITAVIIRNNAVKESAGEEKVGNEDLANDDSMNKFGEAEAPSDMFPNGQDDYEVQKWGEYQKYWDDFSVYGTYGPTDAPPTGGTGYNEDYLVEKTTDKGAKCIVDTRTGKVYYHNMILPTGIRYSAGKETNAMAGYYLAEHDNLDSQYSFTYADMQDCYGYPIN